MPTTARFRLALGGLAEPDGAMLRDWLADGELNAAPQWELADHDADLVIVDPDADGAANALGDRRFGSLVVLALRPGETAWPGTLCLSRPLDPRQVDLTLSLAAQIVGQPAFAGQTPPSAPPAANMTTAADLDTEDAPEATAAADAPFFAEAVEEAAVHEEQLALEDEVESQAEASQADAEAAAAANPFDAPAVQDEADDAAIDRLALAVMEERAPSDEAEPEIGNDTTTIDEAIVELSGDGAAPIELLSFSDAAEGDPLDQFDPEAQTDAGEEDSVLLSDDFADAEAVLADAEQMPAFLEPVETAIDRPGPFDDLKPAHTAPVEHDDVEAPAPAADAPTPEAPASADLATDEDVDEELPEETAAEPAPVAATMAEEFPAPTVALDDVQSLADLATAYREQLYRERHVVVRIDNHAFHLEPYAGECYSTSPAAALEAYRGHGNVSISIAIEEAPAADRPTAAVRLVDFLWHLGFHAGNASLLPWVEADARYRITRQPPMDEDAKETGVLQIAQLISRTPVAVADMPHLAGASEQVVHDFLNGCSLVGYLERVAQPVRRRPDAPQPGRRTQAHPSLMGSLRRRIGLEK